MAKPFLALLALATGSCTGTWNKQSADLLFGVSPVPAGASQGSNGRGAERPAGDIAVRDVVRASFKIAGEHLQPCLSAERKRKIASLKPITISNRSNVQVLSYYDPATKTITVSELTWRNFVYSALSSRMIDMNVGTDLEWHARYRLYLRMKSPFDQVESPPKIAGLNKDWTSADSARELFAYVLQEAQYNATFLLAHEYYHHLEPISQALNESNGQFLQRRQQHELDADNFAMIMLMCRSAIDGKLDVLLKVPLLFLDWVLLLQGQKSSLISPTHPMDHRRMRNASAFVISKLEMLHLTGQRLSLIEGFRELIAKADRIDREGPENFFATIDAEARSVTRSSLLLKN
jgi:hypothetical protein